jgi:ribokinase
VKVLTIGTVTTDLLMQVDRLALPDEEVRVSSQARHDGGSAANVAVGLCRLGCPAAFFGCVGADDEGARHLASLSAEGVDTSRVIVSSTGQSTSHVLGFVDPRGARQLYFHGGASEEITPLHITHDLLDGIDWVHVCTLGPDFAERVIALNRERRPPVALSLDPGCVGLEGDRAAHLRRLLREAHALFVNQVEFGQLFPGLSPEQVMRLGGADLPEWMAIKLGERGAWLVERHRGPTYYPAYPVAAVDSTGAGDAFAAGCLAGLAVNTPLVRLGPFANAVAALVTTRVGCRDGLPSREAVASFLARQEGLQPADGRQPSRTDAEPLGE